MKDKLRFRVLGAWADFVCRRPVLVLVIASVMAIVAGGYAYTHFKFQPNRNDLISKRLPWNQRFIDWQEHFPGSLDFYIVVDAGPADQAGSHPKEGEARAVVDELGATMLKHKEIKAAVWGFNTTSFSPRAMRLEPMDKFKFHVDQLKASDTLLQSPTPAAMLDRIEEQMRSNDSDKNVDEKKAASDIRDLRQLISGIGVTLETPLESPVDFGKLATSPEQMPSDWQYMASRNNRLYFIRVTPALDMNDPSSIDAMHDTIVMVRSEIKATLGRHPAIEAGLTGVEVMESDETEVALFDGTWTSCLAAVAIAIFLTLAFHSFRTPLLAMISLGFGIAWTFGFLFLTVGHIQVLSQVFVLLLLGIGVDYGVLLSSAYELHRHNFPDDYDGFRLAMREAFITMGPGIVTGCVTAAASFGMTMITDFTGVAEMGQIAGAGVLLCLLAMLTVFPALIGLVKPMRKHVATMDERWVHVFNEEVPLFFSRHSRATLAIGVVLAIASVFAMFSKQFDYDLLKIQPRGVESIVWQERIVRDGEESIWFGISMVKDIPEARKRTAEFLSKPTVGGVGGIGLLFPEHDDQKIAMLTETRKALDAPLSQVHGAATQPAAGSGGGWSGLFNLSLTAKLKALKLGIGVALMGSDVPAPIRHELTELRKEIEHAIARYDAIPEAQKTTRMDRLNQAFAKWRLESAKQIALALDTSPLSPRDLPDELLRSYIDDKGRMALEIYPRMPNDPTLTGPLDTRFLPNYINDLKAVDPVVTGVIVQIYESGSLIKNAYEFAGLLAFLAVVVVVWIDFRSIHDTILALFPVAVGFAITFGIMWLVGMQINAANIIVLPLMFGIGVSAGINIVHRYRQDPITRPLGLTGGTGKGVTITSITSILGFSAMVLASHRGIQSLGLVLSIGLTMTLLACYTVMPAWMEVRNRLLGVDGSKSGGSGESPK